MQAPTPSPSGDRNGPRGRGRFFRVLVHTVRRRLRRCACLAGLVGLAVPLSGCTSLKDYIHNGLKVGPNYGRPPAPVAQNWIDAADPRVRTDYDDLSRWWTVFNDPILNALICDAYRQNLTLREAGFRVLEARAELGIALGELFPQLQTASGSFIQRGVSVKVANRSATPQRWFGT